MKASSFRAFYRKLPLRFREFAWQTVDRLPPPAQRLFPHTDEHRRWKMQQLYRRTPAPVPGSPTVLFWVPGGMELMLHVETAIAAALQLRGYTVHAVICDAPYTACVRREAKDGIDYENWRAQCARCISANRGLLDMMGIPYSSVGTFVSQKARESLWDQAQQVTPENVRELSHHGVSIGNNVISSMIRYRRGYHLADDDRILKQYAYTALITAESARVAIGRFKASRIFMSHGIYVDWGPALHTALDLGIPITTWKSSYLSARFYMQQVRDGHLDFYRLKDASWNLRAATPLTESEDRELDAALHTRYHHPVAFDVPRLHREMGEKERFRAQYGIDPEKPVWGIMCHVNWDSVADYSPMAYSSFDEWTKETIQQVSRIPDVQWLIKVHPVEASYDRQVGVEKLIETHFPDLPPHVKLVPSTEKISPFEFFEMLDGGVTVYGTPGLELALAGKPVILAGEAHYGRKGFTHDAFDADSYRNLLARAAAMGPLTPEQRTLARRYAYSVFIQRQIPLPVVRDPERLWWNLQHQKRERLLPGADPFLDFICARIIDGGDFIMDRNLVELAESESW